MRRPGEDRATSLPASSSAQLSLTSITKYFVLLGGLLPLHAALILGLVEANAEGSAPKLIEEIGLQNGAHVLYWDGVHLPSKGEAHMVEANPKLAPNPNPTPNPTWR